MERNRIAKLGLILLVVVAFGACTVVPQKADHDREKKPAVQEAAVLPAPAVPEGFLAGLHGKNDVGCADCHGKELPAPECFVEATVCLNCHGSYGELAGKTLRPEEVDVNPHNSHLGELRCTLCHKGHSPSKAYCLQCHTDFHMPMPM